MFLLRTVHRLLLRCLQGCMLNIKQSPSKSIFLFPRFLRVPSLRRAHTEEHQTQRDVTKELGKSLHIFGALHFQIEIHWGINSCIDLEQKGV